MLARTFGIAFAFVLLTGVNSQAFDQSFSYEVDLRALAEGFPYSPDRARTPGSLCTEDDQDFQRLRYEEEIPYCERNVDGGTKSAIYRMYGVDRECTKEYTIDHLIPLSIGGTNHPDNLWPEHKSIKALRKNLEMNLFKRMEKGTITQAEAVRTVLSAKFNPPVRNPGDYEFCR